MCLTEKEKSVLEYILGNVKDAMEEDKFLSEGMENKHYTSDDRVCLVLKEYEIEALESIIEKNNS